MTDPETLVVRGGRVVDPSTDRDAIADVVVERGRIVRVGKDAARQLVGSERVTVIEAAGHWVLPAFVDLHAHLREPGQEYKEDIQSGLAAAASGGFAHVCVMPNTKPVNDTRSVTELMLARAKEVGGPSLHPIGAITLGQKGRDLTEMAELREAGAIGVSDDGVCVMNSAVMRRALEYAKTFDLVVIQHAEDHDLTQGAQMNEGKTSSQLGLRGWPRVAEDIIVARDILLAEYVQARYHVAHLSTQGSARIVTEGKSRGVDVTAEVTPHHLLLTDSAVLGYNTACKVNPPLREAEDVAALRRALANGTIDAIATDHAPHTGLEKDCEFQEASPGMVGLQLCFGALLSLVGKDGLTLSRLVDALSAAPARIAGLEAPRLKEGCSAELVVVDPEARWTPQQRALAGKSHNSPLMDREMHGRVLLTLAGGKIAFEQPSGEAR